MDRFTHWPVRAMADWSYVDEIRAPRGWRAVDAGPEDPADEARVVVDLTALEREQVGRREEQLVR